MAEGSGMIGQPPDFETAGRKTALIVDDSSFDRRVLAAALEAKAGLRTIEAGGFAECRRALEREKVDVVLMDIMMPEELGSTALAKLRATRNAIELPVIMVTGKSDDAEIVRCLRAGANDFISKPVNFDVAASRITAHLRLAELSRETSRVRELKALTAMASTFDHEINNPLAIALGSLDRVCLDPKSMERLRAALWRIADIVKLINAVGKGGSIEFDPSAQGSGAMIKIR